MLTGVVPQSNHSGSTGVGSQGRTPGSDFYARFLAGGRDLIDWVAFQYWHESRPGVVVEHPPGTR